MKTDLLQDVEVDYAASIAMESELLEKIFAKELEDVRGNVAPTSWYSAALEDSSQALTNSNNTDSVVKRLVEYLRKFVARLIEYFKNLLAGKKSKEAVEYIKAYKGPSELTYSQCLISYAKLQAKEDEKVAERIKALPAPPAKPTMAEAEKFVEEATGKNTANKEEAFRNTRLQEIFNKLGKNNIAVLEAMLSDEFFERFHKASEITNRFTHERVYHDNVEKHYEYAKEVMEMVMVCNEDIREGSGGHENIEKWVTGSIGNTYARRIIDYAEIEVTMLYCSHYLKGFNSLIKELESMPGEQAVEKLKITQSTLAALVAFISLASRAGHAYDAAANGMYGI